MKTIFDFYTLEGIEEKISAIDALALKNIPDSKILEILDIPLKDELLSIFNARKKSKKSKNKCIGDAKYYNVNDLRFSTPLDVSIYRSKRLKCNRIVDLCSGIGIQANSFSEKCNVVMAVEIDPRKAVYSKENFDKKNLTFIEGDVLDDKIIEKARNFKPDIIFCDPERKEEEQERSIETIKPNLKKVIEVYSKITKNICIEIPPQIDIQKLKNLGNYELEYLSYNNKLNRLNLYFGDLKKHDVSAADISGIRITKNEKINEKIADGPKNFIYEASTAIIKAGLTKEYSDKIKSQILENKKNRFLLTSDYLSTSNEAKCFSKIYKLIGISKNYEDSIRILKRYNFGKVILKKSINPEEYWKERERYQKFLRGKKEAYVFDFQNNSIHELICEAI